MSKAGPPTLEATCGPAGLPGGKATSHTVPSLGDTVLQGAQKEGGEEWSRPESRDVLSDR